MQTQPKPANAEAQILAWAKKLDPWQSDALRRAFVQAGVTTEDVQQVFSMAAAAVGIPQVAAPTPVLVQPGDLGALPSHSAADVRLKAVHGLTDVNALIPGQRLEMASAGLTIVYGENGSGKTGYARVLKRACHARHGEPSVLPNILAVGGGKPTATVDYLVNGFPATFAWSEGGTSDPHLRRAHVFDAKCGLVLVDEANEVIFEPETLAGLSRFATLLGKVRGLAEKERLGLGGAPAWPDAMRGQHEVGKLIGSLSQWTDPQEIERLSTLAPADLSRKEQLAARRDEIRAKNDELKTKLLRDILARLKPVREAVDRVRGKFSDEAAAKHAALGAEAVSSKEASAIAAQAFAGDPLPGTGSAPAWRQLFDAARAYSQTAAYPAKEFPAAGASDLCVLCQQPLSGEAQDRLRRFAAFVANDAMKKERAAQEQSAASRRELERESFSMLTVDDPLAARLLEVGFDASAARVALSAFVREATVRRDAQLRSLAESIPALPVITSQPDHALDGLIAGLDARIRDLSGAETAVELLKIEEELAALTARATFAQQKTAVLGEVARLRRIAMLQKIEDDASTRPVSTLQSKLAEKLLTKEFGATLAAELKALGLDRYAFRPYRTVVQGQARHQLRLEGAASSSTGLSRVLSEGEQRSVALAAFLAEAALADAKSLLLDDPVTSLDHHWTERIARRLVDIAAVRQVIVFTHDITFLVTLAEVAEERQVPILTQTVTRAPNGAGRIEAEIAWEAKKLAQRIPPLKSTAALAREEFKKNGESAQYGLLCTDFFGKLRATWERVVEEGLFYGVVRRFERPVHTNQLDRVVLEDADIVAVDRHMTRVSQRIEAHDRARVLGKFAFHPDDLDAECKELQDFVTPLESRRKKLQERRKALTPPLVSVPPAPPPLATG